LVKTSVRFARGYGKLPALFFVNQTAENEAGVKSWPAHPNYVSVFVDVSCECAISNHSKIIRMSVHFS
jgi:hypothetical protein